MRIGVADDGVKKQPVQKGRSRPCPKCGISKPHERKKPHKTHAGMDGGNIAAVSERPLVLVGRGKAQGLTGVNDVPASHAFLAGTQLRFSVKAKNFQNTVFSHAEKPGLSNRMAECTGELQ